MRTTTALTLAAATLATTVAGPAHALSPAKPPLPPYRTTIVPGVGMAGVKLGTLATGPVDGRLTSPPFDGWGDLKGDFCFEGTSCGWDVPGSGGRSVFIDRDGRTSRVLSISTSAPAWKTAKGIGPGATVAQLKRAYPKVQLIRTCQIGGFGAELVGYRLNLHTLFNVNGGRVAAVYVTSATLRGGRAACG